MTAISYIESVKKLSVLTANAKLQGVCGVRCFFEADPGLSLRVEAETRETKNSREEYGDWQTNMELATSVCRFLKAEGISPKVIVEPTCGRGNFILAALQTFDDVEDIYGIEIHQPYISELKLRILQYYLDNPDKRKVNIHLFHRNIFDFNLSDIKKTLKHREVLVLGNPPWATNSKLGGINSENLPLKTNFKRLSGLDAIMGKSNFDIAEYICRMMIDFLTGERGHLALLLKNTVIKNIVYDQRESKLPISDIRQFNIDAKKEFDVSVAAALFSCVQGDKIENYCLMGDFYTRQICQEYGWVDDCFVSDIGNYRKFASIDGVSPLVWWSGIKHDCAKVMELSLVEGEYINGLGEVVDIEQEMIYPLLKSSDIKGEQITSVRKYVIVTQESTSDDTEWIKIKYPKAYRYLLDHSIYLDNRGSRIYKGRSRFSMFGIGKYSFKPYKIAVSGLYKIPNFAIVHPIEGKCVMLDDTCYMLGLDTLDDAIMTKKILDSEPVRLFIDSLMFTDAKRVINKDLLMRVNLLKALEPLADSGFDEERLKNYVAMLKANIAPKQYSLFD